MDRAAAQSLPADPAAASGMTTGLPGVSSARQAEMMAIRARAQAARPDAERAAMERSAEDQLARQSQENILVEARETRRLKDEAARQLLHQRAANAYQGVRLTELDSWSQEEGRVRVERGVPPELLAALAEEEASSPASDEGGGFHPFRLPKKAASAAGGAAMKGVSWIPGLGKEDEGTGLTARPRSQESASAPDIYEDEEKKGFFRGILGGRDKGEADYVAPAPAPMAAAPQPLAPAPAPPYPSDTPGLADGDSFESGSLAVGGAPAEADSPGLFKKLALGGSGKPEDSSRSSGDDLIPGDEPRGGGLRGLFGKVIPGGGSGGNNDRIDASLFPQTGEAPLVADTSSSGDGERRKLFSRAPSLPELPQLSLPSSQSSSAPKTAPPKRERSPVHSGGSASYMVQSDGAQFMRFAGGGALGSEAVSLSAGTQVVMTNVGDEWSSIQLSDGSAGIIRNKDLRPSSGQAGRAVAAVPPVSAPAPSGAVAAASPAGPARIITPVSATGAGISDVPGPPVGIPTSSLTGGALPPPPIPPSASIE